MIIDLFKIISGIQECFLNSNFSFLEKPYNILWIRLTGHFNASKVCPDEVKVKGCNRINGGLKQKHMCSAMISWGHHTRQQHLHVFHSSSKFDTRNEITDPENSHGR